MKNKTNVWKIVAIVFIIGFSLILIASVFRWYGHRPARTIATEQQKEQAIESVTKFMQGDSLSNYQMRLPDSIRSMHGENRQTMQLSLYNDSVNHMFIIDANTGELLVHSITEWIGVQLPKNEIRERGIFSPPRP